MTYFIYVFLLIRKRIIFILYVFGALTHLVYERKIFFKRGTTLKYHIKIVLLTCVSWAIR